MLAKMLTGMLDCMEELVYDVIVQGKSNEEINSYENVAGDFRRKIVVKVGETLLTAERWSTYGISMLLSLRDVLSLFSNTNRGQNSNLNFLNTHVLTSFEKCPTPWCEVINPKGAHTCDFLTMLKINSHLGGVEIIEKWVMGAFVDHTAFCLKDDTDIHAKFNSKAVWECAQSMSGQEILSIYATTLVRQ
ncbi:hypothetical protein V6N11_009050 [Hibiscus sabdariffa]|uniref:Uncharacterized protein n=1 Tax=Hibiscus sabdariffa TaxID=183260 RepID=A0ABR2PPW1_9ROSI